ncbi:hypothetical protein RHOSPDRAFT_32297 [Rhodotorula sp. JG-1b]|nr:hypothetical protein RHOSPDRAFT_32297 [Rhodotorula sp. JG-1b]
MRQAVTAESVAAAAQTSTAPGIDDAAGWIREGPVRLLQNGDWKRKNGPVACELPRPAPLIWVHPLDLQIESKPIKRLRSSEAGSLAQTEKNPSAPRPEKFKRQAPPTSLQNEAQQPFTRPTGPVLPAKRTRPVNVPSEPRRFTPLEASTAPNPPTKLAILAALGAELFDLESWRKRHGPAPLARFAYPVSSLRTDDDAPNSSHKSQDGSDAGDRRAGSSRRLSTSTSSDILETSTEQMLAGMYSSGTFHRDHVAR